MEHLKKFEVALLLLGFIKKLSSAGPIEIFHFYNDPIKIFVHCSTKELNHISIWQNSINNLMFYDYETALKLIIDISKRK